jgi:hypothetical protein
MAGPNRWLRILAQKSALHECNALGFQAKVAALFPLPAPTFEKTGASRPPHEPKRERDPRSATLNEKRESIRTFAEHIEARNSCRRAGLVSYPALQLSRGTQ